MLTQEEKQSRRQELNRLAEKAVKTQDSEDLGALLMASRPIVEQAYKKYKWLVPDWTVDDLHAEASIKIQHWFRQKKYDVSRKSYSGYCYVVCRSVANTHAHKLQNHKHRAMHNYVGNVEYNNSGEEADLHHGSYEIDILGSLADREEYVELIRELAEKCSLFESLVLYFYLQNQGYQEICDNINAFFDKQKDLKVFVRFDHANKKSVDNGLGRVKVHAKKILAEKLKNAAPLIHNGATLNPRVGA